jgi:hypothetical protein
MGHPEKLVIYGTQDEDKQTRTQHNTICFGHHYTQTNTNNVNKTWVLLLTICFRVLKIYNIYFKHYLIHHLFLCPMLFVSLDCSFLMSLRFSLMFVCDEFVYIRWKLQHTWNIIKFSACSFSRYLLNILSNKMYNNFVYIFNYEEYQLNVG